MPLWKSEFGSGDEDEKLILLILDVIKAIRNAYGSFHPPTDTLVTKVILGTLGCLPACDQYFKIGFKRHYGSNFSLNVPSFNRVMQFCRKNSRGLLTEQAKIEAISGIKYPLMKLVDMYFHEAGFDR